MSQKRIRFGLIFAVLAAVVAPVYAVDLSIHDVQFVADPGANDASPYFGEIHSVVDGIVTHVWHGFNDRVYLRDPSQPTWGAIVVKDGEGGELSNNVSVGDRVRLDNIYIDEFRGTTFLQYRRSFAPDVSFTVIDSGNPVPAPTLLTAADIINPANHGATEPYESMMVTLLDVVVGQRDLGKADDNYELLQGGNIAWGTDYMNIDAGALYDPRIVPGAFLNSITGVVEQYTKLEDGWDYYQLNTRSAGDIVPEPSAAVMLAAGGVLILSAGRRRCAAA